MGRGGGGGEGTGQRAPLHSPTPRRHAHTAPPLRMDGISAANFHAMLFHSPLCKFDIARPRRARRARTPRGQKCTARGGTEMEIKRDKKGICYLANTRFKLFSNNPARLWEGATRSSGSKGWMWLMLIFKIGSFQTACRTESPVGLRHSRIIPE